MGQGWIAAAPCRLTGAVRRCWARFGACAQRHMPACILKPHRHAARDCFQIKILYRVGHSELELQSDAYRSFKRIS